MANNRDMSYPTFNHDEIIKICQELGEREDVPVSVMVLKSPSKETTIAIFDFILQDILGLSLDQVSVVPFEQLSKVQYPDAYPETRLLRFYGTLQRLLTSVRYDDFAVTDLTQPTPTRLRRQLSALLNFTLHVQRLQDSYGDGVLEARKHAKEYSSRVVQENRDLKAGIHSEMAREETLRAELQQAETAADQRASLIDSLKRQKEELQLQARRLKADVGSRESELQTLAVQEAKLKEDKSNLEAQMVRSPERVRERLANAKKELQAAEDQLVAASERKKSLLRMRADMEKLLETADQFQSRMETLKDLSDRQTETTSKIKEEAASMASLRQTIDQTLSTTRQLRKKIEMIGESRENQLLKNSQFLEEKQTELETRKQATGRTQEQLTEGQQRALQLQQVQQQVEQQLQLDQQQHQERMAAFQQDEDNVRTGVQAVKAQAKREQQLLLQSCAKLRERFICK